MSPRSLSCAATRRAGDTLGCRRSDAQQLEDSTPEAQLAARLGFQTFATGSPPLVNRTVALLLIGDAFLSRTLSGDTRLACNMNSTAGQREASLSFIRNAIAPLEAHGAHVSVLIQNRCPRGSPAAADEAAGRVSTTAPLGGVGPHPNPFSASTARQVVWPLARVVLSRRV